MGATLEKRSSTSHRPSSAAGSPFPSFVTCLSPQGSVLTIIPPGPPPTAMPSCPSTHPHPLADTLISSTHIYVWTHKTPLKTHAAMCINTHDMHADTHPSAYPLYAHTCRCIYVHTHMLYVYTSMCTHVLCAHIKSYHTYTQGPPNCSSTLCSC